jgi:hypothetical protein
MNWRSLQIRLEGYDPGHLELPPLTRREDDFPRAITHLIHPIEPFTYEIMAMASLTLWLDTFYEGGPLLITVNYCGANGCHITTRHLKSGDWQGKMADKPRNTDFEGFVAALIGRTRDRSLPDKCDIIVIPLEAGRN